LDAEMFTVQVAVDIAATVVVLAVGATNLYNPFV